MYKSGVVAVAFLCLAYCCATGVRKKMVCEYETMNLSCLEDQRLDIKYVDFGRQNAIYCNTRNHWTTRVTNCTTKPSSFIAVSKRCQHKRECAIPAHYGVLGDPCDLVQKYLEVGYECLQGDVKSKTACENEKLTVSCPDNKKIVINEASYGRTNPITCNVPGTIINTNVCTSVKSTAVLTATCDGKTSCTVDATSSVFGDPCPRISKFLEVKFTCQ